MRETQLAELDLRSGCITNESPLALFQGGRLLLQESVNCGWQPAYATAEWRKRALGILPHVSGTPTITCLGAAGADTLHAILGIAATNLTTGVVMTREKASPYKLHFNKLSDGSSLFATAQETINPERSGPSVYWPEKLQSYFSYPGTGMTYKGTELIGVSPWEATTQNPGEPYRGNSALALHLDRLWLAMPAAQSKIWFTDPFDDLTVRPANFLSIPDNVTCMFRTTPGPVTAGGASHLVIGAWNSVWVLDGDPVYGNAVLRQLSASAGIADKVLVTETPYGALALMTNGDFALIPPGAGQLIPLPQLRAIATAYRTTALPSSLAWVSPYVVYLQADLNAMWLLDISNLQQLRVWGPIRHAGGSSPFRVWDTMTGWPTSLARPIYFGALTTSTAPTLHTYVPADDPNATGRAASLKSGHLSVPGRRVEARRVIVELAKPAADYTLACHLYRADGTAATVLRTVSGSGTPAADRLTKVVFDYSVAPVVTDSFYVNLVWPAATEPALHRVLVEYRTQPRQD